MSTEKGEGGGAPYGSLRLAPNVDETIRPKPLLPRQYVSFTFYRARPEWRVLNEDEKEKGKLEFIKAFEEFQRDLLMHTYSLVGLRTNAEFMIWRIMMAT